MSMKLSSQRVGIKNIGCRRISETGFLTSNYLLLTLIGIVLLFPYFYMVTRSLMSYDQLREQIPGFIPKPLDLNGWKDAFITGGYVQSTLRTMAIVSFNIVAAPLSASLVAFGFARTKFAGSRILFSMMLGTMMLPGVVTQIPLYTIFNNFGWLNTILPLTIPNLFGGGAIFIFLIRQFMRGIPKELDRAAYIDGANIFQIYWKIILPLCAPVLIFVVISVFNANWGDFYGPLMYMRKAGNETLAYRLFLEATSTNVGTTKENIRMAAGTFMSIFPLILFFIFQKQLIEGVSTTGLKG